MICLISDHYFHLSRRFKLQIISILYMTVNFLSLACLDVHPSCNFFTIMSVVQLTTLQINVSHQKPILTCPVIWHSITNVMPHLCYYEMFHFVICKYFIQDIHKLQQLYLNNSYHTIYIYTCDSYKNTSIFCAFVDTCNSISDVSHLIGTLTSHPISIWFQGIYRLHSSFQQKLP